MVKRVKISSIVESQLPEFVREDFPLAVEFLQEYYRSLEFQGGTLDILQNIDKYTKLEELVGLTEEATLTTDTSYVDTVIAVNSTLGFPNTYGLIQIDSEVITYTGITTNTFTGCLRGFSGISSYRSKNNPDTLVFSDTRVAKHTSGSAVKNLSILFLKEFLKKIKTQVTPGFEERELYSGLNQNLFIKQSKDFYESKGADESFEILFRALYGVDVEVLKPRDYLFGPSDAQYRITKDLIVESVFGDPLKLISRTLFQDETDVSGESSGSITRVEKLTKNSKDYYKISLDSDYDKDINVFGSISGEFKVHPKTKVITAVSAGATTLDVDSTVGFPTTGTLVVLSAQGVENYLSYESKTLNQFFGCNGSPDILAGTDIRYDVYAYGYEGPGTTNQIQVRIGAVLSDLEFLDSPYGLTISDTIKINSLGSLLTDQKSNNWIFNIPSTYDIKTVQLVDISDYTYRFTTYDRLTLQNSDFVDVLASNGISFASQIKSIENENTFQVTIGTGINEGLTYKVFKKLTKVSSANFPAANKNNANVQNVYTDLKNSLYVTSSSIPSYFGQDLKVKDESITFSGVYNNNQSINIGVHGLFTGDAVTYVPGSGSNRLNIASENVATYFVKKISDNEISLYRSRANVFNNVFIPITGTVTNNKFERSSFSGKILETQKLIRKFSEPNEDSVKSYETKSGKIGMLVNGVEILNYKSPDVIFYGPIESIVATSGGSEYDVINPPVLQITDLVGIGATGVCSVEGSFEDIKIVDGGFDYIETPTISIVGGGGNGATAKADMITVSHVNNFNTSASALEINLNTDTIGFSSFHKFRNGEAVIYSTNGESNVGGIFADSQYYVATVSEREVQLHRTYEDVIAGINTINLTSHVNGTHSLTSIQRKRIINGIKVTNSGSRYKTKQVSVSPEGIDVASNIINFNNHTYSGGEILVYTPSSTPITGLSSNSTYYVTKVNENQFRLSAVGVGTTVAKDFYYSTNQFIDLKSQGAGVHNFNYEPIKVIVNGVIGVTTFSGQNFGAVLQPIVRGEITGVTLTNGGVGYGSSEIIGDNRQPSFTLNRGSGALLQSIVINGAIVEVIVKSGGVGYNSPPKLKIIGDGLGAELVPIIQNGAITEVFIANSGYNYTNSKTSIDVVPAGFGANFQFNIKTWTINLFQKHLQNNNIVDDDGILSAGLNLNYGLQYTHLYAPRKLRQNIYREVVRSNQKVFIPDLIIDPVSNVEKASVDHSPIIGWAYDGSPIYGPYGYDTPAGGIIRALKSGYERVSLSNRPPLPQGFFINDFIFNGMGDLDKHNGRFCITPEYPNGIYAYFTTISAGSVESTGPFSKFKIPEFPYFIGNEYRYAPDEFNFKTKSNQDEFDLVSANLSRNTTPYNLTSETQDYPYVLNPNKIQNHDADVKSVVNGRVDSIEIVQKGINYKVGDQLIFDNSGTSGYGAAARVSRVGGAVVTGIAVSSSQTTDIEFSQSGETGTLIGFCTQPHNFKNNDEVTISGLSTTDTGIQRFFSIGVPQNTFVLRSGIGSTSVTGIITYISVSGSLSYPDVAVNDVYTIENEKVKILAIDEIGSRLKIERKYTNTSGVAHTASTFAYEDSRKFFVNVGYSKDLNLAPNKEIYFNPVESIAVAGIGATDLVSVVGIATTSKITVSFSNPGTGVTSVILSAKQIYLPNHGLKTNDRLVYKTNNGDPIRVSLALTSQFGTNFTVGINTFTLANNSIVYAARISDDIIGIATNPIVPDVNNVGTFVGIGSTTNSILFFENIGSGVNHSFKTNYSNTLSGLVDRNVVTVSTASTHNLIANENIRVNVFPGITTSIKLTYNDEQKRVLGNKVSFAKTAVDLLNNIITISNHGFVTGQKILYKTAVSSSDRIITSNTSIDVPTIFPSPLEVEIPFTLIATENGIIIVDAEAIPDNSLFYVVVLDYNRIQLSSTYYDATKANPTVIDMISNTFGSIAPVNPPVALIRNQIVEFDLSDSSLSYVRGSISYPAFNLNFYKDINFKNRFISSGNSSVFEVTSTGTVGTSGAKVSILVSDKLPKNFYYRLEPNDILNISEDKKNIIVDEENIPNHNAIIVTTSVYSGNHRITGIGSTSIQYNVLLKPEKSSYNTSEAVISYDTNSIRALGPINEIDIRSKGKNYQLLPSIVSVASTWGKASILESRSTSIGNIKKYCLTDIGFDYPSDYTLRPSASAPQILKLEPLTSIERIGINSVGRGYSIAPNLVFIDGFTNKIVDAQFSYNIKDSQVSILKNNFEIYNVAPIIIPVNNTNGVGISSITYNFGDKTVQVILNPGAVGYSTVSSFPFSVGDKVLIENVSVGIGSTGKGFNSKNYGYKLFTITATDPNIGGAFPTITYSLDGDLSDGKVPGAFNPINSNGRVISLKDFPIFSVTLKRNQFLLGETIKSGNKSGEVENWSSRSDNLALRVSGADQFLVNDFIRGQTTGSIAIVKSVQNFRAIYKTGAGAIVAAGFNQNTGFLNDSIQRLPDNDYYQYFSYSLKSPIEIKKWDNPVSSLDHTAGFKKFSDMQVVSFGATTGITTDQNDGDFLGIANIDRIIDLNCTNDFDLATENNIIIDDSLYSDEIILKSTDLQDYFESIGNRVLMIDDISDQFDDNPRQTRFSVIDEFLLTSFRSRKYLLFIQDRRFTETKETGFVSILHDNTFGYLNQYARVETVENIGYFDFDIVGDTGRLLFYPEKYSYNDFDVTFVAYGLKDGISGIGTTSLGNVAEIKTSTTSVLSGVVTPIVSIASTYRASKLLIDIQTDDQRYEFDELTLIHDGNGVCGDIEAIEYAQLTTHSIDAASSVGLGTYSVACGGSNNIIVNFHPFAGVAATVDVLRVSIGNTAATGIGTTTLNTAIIDSHYTSIASTSSPVATTVARYDATIYNGGYYIAVVEDLTNDWQQVSELMVATNDEFNNITEFGEIITVVSLGEFGVRRSGNEIQVTFEPNPDAHVEVRIFQNSMRRVDPLGAVTKVDLNNGTIESGAGVYFGTENDIKRQFELTHKNRPIFKNIFNPASAGIVSVTDNTIRLQQHFFVTGEAVDYVAGDRFLLPAPIGIASTTISGIGLTDKLPSTVFIVKVNEVDVQVSASVTEALSVPPSVLDITSVGIGSLHRFESKKQNTKGLITIDNMIQSPVANTNVKSSLVADVQPTTDRIKLSGITSVSSGDILKIDDEIMRVQTVGVGTTNVLVVNRPWMGTGIATHVSGAVVTKLTGNYNIINNQINFISAPYGPDPISTTTSGPNERDWSGVSTHSTFSGRVFTRTSDLIVEPYTHNLIFDNISEDFNGITTAFRLKSDGVDVTNVAQDNGIVLIRDIYQGPRRANGSVRIIGDYELVEGSGITTAIFKGTDSGVKYDNNTNNIPRGGIIVSAGSSQSRGYQPLVAAGATATINGFGAISVISIGNTGSGYRELVQKEIIISAFNPVTGTSSTIGIATAFDGHIIGYRLDSPGTAYTTSNPPTITITSPAGYADIPLVYSQDYPNNSGVGTGLVVNVVVGAGSSVIDYDIVNYGFGYKQGDVLTFARTGATSIPLNSGIGHTEFTLTVEKTYNDEFNGWACGNFLPIDDISILFNGYRTEFPIVVDGVRTSIRAKRGSQIDIQACLLVFINNILQVPGQGYVFSGGSTITFTEAPKGSDPDFSWNGDVAKIIFYRGTKDIDVELIDVLETIKKGDTVELYDDNIVYAEDYRLVTEVTATDTLETNVYPGPGITTNLSYERALQWCRQTEDKLINGQPVAKDREIYKALINPTSSIIQNVSAGTTTIYVESVKTFFDNFSENVSGKILNTIEIVSQDSICAAAATAVVSVAGTISSIVLTNPVTGIATTAAGGAGYISIPSVSISLPTGIGTTGRATAIANISNGIVTSFTITNPGFGYTFINAPLVMISPPDSHKEEVIAKEYLGDFGSIVGIATTTIVGVATTGVKGLVLNLDIPADSFLRNVSNVGSAITETRIEVGDYFTINKSNLGFGVTSLRYSDGSVISYGSTFFDGVYQVANVSYASSLAGTLIEETRYVTIDPELFDGPVVVGPNDPDGTIITGNPFTFSVIETIDSPVKIQTSSTAIIDGGVTLTIDDISRTSLIVEATGRAIIGDNVPSRITVRVEDYNGLQSQSHPGSYQGRYYGGYSWGKIFIPTRVSSRNFVGYSTEGYIGISSSPVVRRKNPLRTLNYV
jgi:hypothetical protein